MTTPVQYIACINHAGFYMNFGLEVFIPQNANTPNVPQGIFMVHGVSTDDYAIGETRVLDLSNAPPVLPEGILVRRGSTLCWASFTLEINGFSTAKMARQRSTR